MAFLRLRAAVFAGAVLTGCGGAPQCNDDWVEETAIDLLGLGETYLRTALIGVRTVRRDLGPSVCAAQVHVGVAGETVHIQNITYETGLTHDGKRYVRLLGETLPPAR